MTFKIGTWVRIDELQNQKNPSMPRGARIAQIQLLTLKRQLIALPIGEDWDLIPFDRLSEIASPLTPYWRFSQSGRYLEVEGDADITQRCDLLLLAKQIELSETRSGKIEKAIAKQRAIISQNPENLFPANNARKAIEEMKQDSDREFALQERLKSYPVVSPAAEEKFLQWLSTSVVQEKIIERSPCLHPNSEEPGLHPNSVRVQDGSLHPNSLHPNSEEPGLHPNSVRVQDGSLHPNSLHPNSEEPGLHPNSLHPNSEEPG